MTGPTKQPPPAHVRGWSNNTPKLARTWDWKLVCVCALVVVVAAWMFEDRVTALIQNAWHARAANPSEGEPPTIPPETNSSPRRSYEDMKEEPVKQEQPKPAEQKVEEEKKAEAKRNGGQRKPTLKELARDAEIGSGVKVAEALPDPDDEVMGEEGGGGGNSRNSGVQKASFDNRGRMTDADGSEFVAGAECQVNAGTPIQVELLTAIDTARPGGQAIGKVLRNVYDTATGKCLAIPAQSTFYGDVQEVSVKNAKAADITFTTLTRPYPRNDTLEFPMSASDSMGRGGVNGRVNSHLGTKIALTAIATGVQLLPALVAKDGGAGSLAGAALGAFLGNAQSPLNKAAMEQLDRPSTIELDPNNPGDRKNAVITVILRRHINADPFDSKAKPQGINANKRRAGG